MGRAPHPDQPGHHHRRLPTPARRKPRRTRPDRAGRARLLTDAAAQGPVPDDHAAAAIWWRLRRTTTPDDTPTIAGRWVDQLPTIVGTDTAHELTESPLWPALLQQVDEAIERGWQPADILGPAATVDDQDPCLALLQRIATLTAMPGEIHVETPTRCHPTTSPKAGYRLTPPPTKPPPSTPRRRTTGSPPERP